jgi:hypothetical protein
MRAIFSLVIALLASVASAQEFKPYPRAKVTFEQWQAYLEEVSSKHAVTRQEAPAEHFVGFNNPMTQTMYTFTAPGHPAHPAWITRQVMQDGTSINVRQIGYFAGDEAPFARLYQDFQALNDRLRQDIRREGK